MKMSLIFAILLLLAMPMTTVFAKGVAGVGLGIDVKNVKDPGLAVQTGLQEQLSDHLFTRLMINKLNYGNSVAVDNIGLVNLYFLGISEKMDIAARLFGDAETEGDNYGYGFGVEYDYFKIKIPETIPLLGDLVGGVIGNEFGAYVNLDVVHRPETNFYTNLGFGITFLGQ